VASGVTVSSIEVDRCAVPLTSAMSPPLSDALAVAVSDSVRLALAGRPPLDLTQVRQHPVGVEIEVLGRRRVGREELGRADMRRGAAARSGRRALHRVTSPS
jgi:hypothetical protein